MTNLLVPLPKTIVLFINESTSDQFTSALNQHLSLKNRLIQLSGKSPGEWTIFPFSVTNSTQTIVSMSTLTTGVGPQEGYSKVHRFPFIWDLAKKRGYETAYFTSQVIHFMNLDIFFNPAKIDHLVSAENYPSPLINDMGIDDIEMAKKVADYLMHASSDQRIFLVINTNALHGPFQDKSSIKIPLTIQDRHAKARYILEEAHRIIFNALTTSSRFDDSLIIITADHGEDPLNRRGINRMIGHYEEFIRIPFAIYLPKNFPAHLKAIIHSNTNRLVSNLDIAPTLLTIFGLQLATHDHYSGYSLLTPIPANRLSVSMSTNEWNQWPDTGFALARGHERFVCISKQLCAYYNVAIDPSERKPIKSGNAFARYLKEVLSIDVLKKEIAML